jgi:hypothetical protein
MHGFVSLKLLGGFAIPLDIDRCYERLIAAEVASSREPHRFWLQAALLTATGLLAGVRRPGDLSREPITPEETCKPNQSPPT